MNIAAKKSDLQNHEMLVKLFENNILNQKGFIRNFSEESFDILKKSGLPGRKDEEYKYFPAFRYFPESPVIPEEYDKSVLPDIKSELFKNPDAIHLVFIDGILSKDYSNLNSRDDNLEIHLMDQLSEKELEYFFSEHLNTQNINHDPFIDLNSSFLKKGVVLKIKKKSNSLPIYCYHLTSSKDKESLVNFRTILILEDDSKASYNELFFSMNNTAGFENHFTEAYVGKGSKLDYYRIQNKKGDEILLNNVNIHQYENSLANTYTFSLAGRMLRNNLNIILEDENCESHLYGLYFVKGKDLIDNHTTVDHKKANCFSNENYKGILDENGKGVFNGKIYVRPNAQKTNAFQSNKNIVLTDTANINTKPQLEIWADDVKCSHGATTGQIDKEQLFYLRTRGLDEKTAKALLLHAFAFEIIDKIEIADIKDYLTKKINKQLGYQFSD